jgi:hypothetical protein
MNTAIDFVFASAYHNLPGISDGEWVGYYAPAEFERLGRDLKSYIEHQLDLFAENSDYAEYFSLADYGDPTDSISDVEEVTFRSALSPAEQNTTLGELDTRDVLHGFRAVILKRVASGDLAEIRSGLELFNRIVEDAIECVDSGNPRSYIRLETAAEFGPRFIDGLLGSVESLKQTWGYDPYERFIGEKFAPLKPLLDLLHTLVHSEAWPRNDLALGELLLIVYYFKRLVEEQWQA